MSEFRDLCVNALKSTMRKIGLDVRSAAEVAPPPPIYDDPLEVISKINSHEFSALNCPLDECVTFNGLSFSSHGWHPFIETASAYIDTGMRKYEGSCLEQYYANWRPLNGRDALIGATLGPSILGDELPHVIHLPWYRSSIKERATYLSHIIDIENACFGGKGLTLLDGYGLHGPVSSQKGRLEYGRIIDLIDSIQHLGYDRWRGDVSVNVLKRDDQYRYVITHGHHRVAVMAALGHKFIPVLPGLLIEDCHVNHWSSVYLDVWKKEEALTYFNHLFDFDSLAWAKKYDFL